MKQLPVTDFVKSFAEIQKARKYMTTTLSVAVDSTLKTPVHKLVEQPGVNPNWYASK